MGLPADVGIFTTDSALVVTTWDPWLVKATGIAADAALGRQLVELAPEIEARNLLRCFHDALAGQVQVLAPALHHYLIQCKPAVASNRFAEMQQRVTIGPLRDQNEIAGVMVAIEDVTARLEGERDLAEAIAKGEALSDDDWRVREASVQRLAEAADRNFVLALVTSLRGEHHNFSLLSSALKLLAITSVDVTVPLLELLKDEDPDLRIQAALALGEQHDPVAIPALVTALHDRNPNVRFQAIESLGRLGAVTAVDDLLAIVESRDFFLSFAALDALAAIGDPRMAPRLVPLLGVDDLRTPVADALAASGDAAVVDPLIAALNESAGAALSIAGALAKLHDRFEREYGDGARIVDAVRRGVDSAGERHLVDAVTRAGTSDLPGLVAVLSWLQSAEIDRTLTRLLGEPAVRAEVVEALARHGEGVVDLLIDQVRSEDREIRHAAIIAIGRVGSPRATPALVSLLDEENDLLLSATGALARIGDRAAFEPLLGLLGHPDGSVRQAAIGALNSIGHPDLAARAAALLDDDDPLVRESAVRIAGYFGYAQTADRMFACLNDSSEAVRRAAIEHLPFLDEDRVLPALLTAIARETPQGRAAAARALARVDATRARDALTTALGDADPWVRYYAARGLGEQRHGAAGQSLLDLADRDPAPHVRIAAVNALGSIGAADTVSRLKRLARDENDQISAAALTALGQIADADGLPELQVAVRADDPMRRGAAVAALASQGSVEAVRSLEWAAAADPDRAIAEAAIEALAQVAKTETPAGHAALDAIITFLSDRGKRERAAAALSDLPVSRIAAVSRGLQHPHPDVRKGTVDALGRFQREEATRLIAQALDDTAEAVRESAVAALARLGARDIHDRIAQLATQDPSKSVRRAAATALKQLPA